MSAIENLLKIILATKAQENNSGKRCPKCQEKEGDLVVLPTRLSITGYLGKNKQLKNGAEAKVELPSLPDFAKKMVSDIPIEHSKYCLQMLRQGYLYILVDFKNGQKQWRIFSSSPEGCLTEYSDNNTIPNIPPKYTCNIATDGADASYISFKNSKDIEKIYFVFSPNKISNARLEIYQDTPEFVLSGMTPDQIRNGQTALKTQDILTNILEISTALDIAEQQAFLKSKPLYDFKTGERDKANSQLQVIEYIYTNRTTYYDKDIMRTYMRYLSLYNKLKKRQGVAIVVNDAIGITQSLNNRCHQAIEKRMKPWMESNDSEGISNEHRLIVHRQLLGFKQSFHNHRIRQLIKHNKQWEKVSDWGNDKITIPSIRDISNNKRREIFQEAEEAFIKQQTEELSEKEFQKFYWDRLSQDKLKNFEQEFNKRSQAAEQLAEKRADDYLKWLKSHQLISALDLYDDTIPLDGIMFQLQMSVCLCGASGYSKVRKVLDEWWHEPQVTPTNLCMRTYLFNNKALIADINEYLDIQQSIIISNNQDQTSTNPKVDKAINILIKVMKHINRVNKSIEALAASGLPIAILSVSFSDLVRSFLMTATKNFDQSLQNRLGNLLLIRIEKSAQKMYKAGLNINGFSFVVEDKEKIPQHIEEIKGEARKNFYSKDLTNTYIAVIVFALSAYESIKKVISGKFKDPREIAQLSASIMGSVAAAFQICNSVIRNFVGKENEITSTVTYVWFGRLFLWASSLIMIAGGISAVLDFVSGYESRKKNQTLIEISYYTRALATLSLSISQFVAALGTLVPWLDNLIKTSIKRTIWVKMAEIGLVIGRFVINKGLDVLLPVINFYASMIIIVVSVCLIIFDDNAMQKWFDRCCFSKDLERKKFKDLDEELTEWHQALQETF